MDGGAVEGFVDVDVAKAGDEALVEEGGLDGAMGVEEASGEAARREGEGLGSHVGVTCITVREDEDAAESAGVAEAKLFGREGEDQVGVRRNGFGGIVEGESAGH